VRREIVIRLVPKSLFPMPTPEKLRDVTPDVGGGFGARRFPITNMRSPRWRRGGSILEDSG
jgi:hypothetical protein